MALPSSSQLSLNDVRIETSQSRMINYSLADSQAGLGLWDDYQVYAPINVYGSSFWSESSPLQYKSYQSMSIWHSYDHTTYYLNTETGSLYAHVSTGCPIKSMIIIDAGTISKYIDFNISGSLSRSSTIEVYYGKPWKNDGASNSSSLSTLIYRSQNFTSLITTHNFYYEYNSNYGDKLYAVLFSNCIFN